MELIKSAKRGHLENNSVVLPIPDDTKYYFVELQAGRIGYSPQILRRFWDEARLKLRNQSESLEIKLDIHMGQVESLLPSLTIVIEQIFNDQVKLARHESEGREKKISFGYASLAYEIPAFDSSLAQFSNLMAMNLSQVRVEEFRATLNEYNQRLSAYTWTTDQLIYTKESIKTYQKDIESLRKSLDEEGTDRKEVEKKIESIKGTIEGLRKLNDEYKQRQIEQDNQITESISGVVMKVDSLCNHYDRIVSNILLANQILYGSYAESVTELYDHIHEHYLGPLVSLANKAGQAVSSSENRRREFINQLALIFREEDRLFDDMQGLIVKYEELGPLFRRYNDGLPYTARDRFHKAATELSDNIKSHYKVLFKFLKVMELTQSASLAHMMEKQVQYSFYERFSAELQAFQIEDAFIHLTRPMDFTTGLTLQILSSYMNYSDKLLGIYKDSQKRCISTEKGISAVSRKMDGFVRYETRRNLQGALSRISQSNTLTREYRSYNILNLEIAMGYDLLNEGNKLIVNLLELSVAEVKLIMDNVSKIPPEIVAEYARRAGSMHMPLLK
ncbi:MAG: hypothetical protein ABIJ34_05745 [archaeon]